MTETELFAIVAMTENRVIGRKGTMPWHLPADLAHFRRHTTHKPCIMGRKVWDSLGEQGHQPLPERPNIVLTRNKAHGSTLQAAGARAFHDPVQALAFARTQTRQAHSSIAIIGGSEIYRLYWDQLQRIELTRIHATLDGDTFFPELAADEWLVQRQTYRAACSQNPYALTFQTLVRHNI